MKKFLNSSIAIKLMVAFLALTILLMIITPALFFNFNSSVGTKVIMGWTALFGGEFRVELDNGSSIYAQGNGTFCWQLYITLLILIVNTACAYIIGPKGRGYYIFAAVVFAACSVVFFTSKIWLNSTFAIESTSIIKNNERLGIGPWFGGFLSIGCAICCIAEFAMRKPAARQIKK